MSICRGKISCWLLFVGIIKTINPFVFSGLWGFCSLFLGFPLVENPYSAVDVSLAKRGHSTLKGLSSFVLVCPVVVKPLSNRSLS